MNIERVDKPVVGPESRRLNKNLISRKFKGSTQQEVDANYNSDEEKDKTMDFDKEIKTPNNLQGIDLVFIIDTTGSMIPFMKSIKELIRTIIRDCEKFVDQFKKSKNLIQVAIVAYRDHGDEKEKDSYVTKSYPFTDSVTARNTVNSLSAKGGFDKAEAVADALNEVNNLKWKSNSQKFIFHFLDGPPHGAEYGNDEKYPKGCPCGLNEEDILISIRDLEPKYTIIKLNDDVNKMVDKFNSILEIETLKLSIDYDQNEKKTQFY